MTFGLRSAFKEYGDCLGSSLLERKDLQIGQPMVECYKGMFPIAKITCELRSQTGHGGLFRFLFMPLFIQVLLKPFKRDVDLK